MQYHDRNHWRCISQLNTTKYGLLQNHVIAIQKFLKNPTDVSYIEFILKKLSKTSTINQTFHLRKYGYTIPLTFIEFAIKLVHRGLFKHSKILLSLFFNDNYQWNNERYFYRNQTILHKMFYKKTDDEQINKELIWCFKMIITKVLFSKKYIHHVDFYGKTFFYYFLQNINLKFWKDNFDLQLIFYKFKLVNKPHYFKRYWYDHILFEKYNCTMLKPLELMQVSNQYQSNSIIREKAKCLIHFYNARITKKCYELSKQIYFDTLQMQHIIETNYIKQKLQIMNKQRNVYIKWFSKKNLIQLLCFISDEYNFSGTLMQLCAYSDD